MPGCGRDEAPDAPASAGESAGPDRGRPADGLYERELAFLAAEGRRALVFSSRADVTAGAGRVHALARLDVGGGWEPLLDETREFAELREPWRLFPLGAARLVVEEDGSLRQLALPGPGGALRLRPIAPPTELPAPGARVSLREASLATPDDSIQGVLVDAMVAFVAGDSAGAALHGVLTAPAGPVVVIAGGEDRGPLLLADVGADELLLAEVRIEGAGRPGEWRVVSPDTSVVGTLRATAAAAQPGGDPIAVAGRIALAGTLYPLAGVVRVPAQ